MLKHVFVVLWVSSIVNVGLTPSSQAVEVPVDLLFARLLLETELCHTTGEKAEIRIGKIEKQMRLLDSVTNAESPRVSQYRHDRLEYLLGRAYLEAGNRVQAYQHLKHCTWANGQYDRQARRILEGLFKSE